MLLYEIDENLIISIHIQDPFLENKVLIDHNLKLLKKEILYLLKLKN